MNTEIVYIYTDHTETTKEILNKTLWYKAYYIVGSYQLHRLDGPAVEFTDGTKEYWVEDQQHRLDGPAIEWADGSKEYWINGICVTQNLKGVKEEDIPKYLKMLSL